MIGPKSRSAALCSFLLVALLAAAKLRTRRGSRPGSRTLAAGCAALVPLLAAVSYSLPLFVVKIGPWANDIGPVWLKKLDDLLTCRISLAWAAYRCSHKNCGPDAPDWPALDNIFVYLLYLTGPSWSCGLRPDDGGAVRLCPPRSVAGCSLSDHAGLWLYGEQVTHLTSDPASAALRCGVCAANRALDV
ncbi:MAG: hypothetical protein ACLURG_06760 [Gemmiger sp.]